MITVVMLCCSACIRTQPQVVVITSTPQSATAQATIEQPATSVDRPTLIAPTLDPTAVAESAEAPRDYVVQPGDTLSGIAALHGVSLETLLAANELVNPDVLAVGQIIQLPEPPDTASNPFKIIPDSRLVRGPGSSEFDISSFVNRQPGYIRDAIDTVDNQISTAAQIVQRVSLEFSVDPRLLLALIEYRAGWLSDPDPSEESRVHPLGAGPSPFGIERDGLYRQLTWAADQLNAGYYGWKYQARSTVEFEDGTRVRFAGGLNAGTIGVQHMLSLFNTYEAWTDDISTEGLYSTYVSYFGDPFAGALEPLVPANLEQPSLALPFSEDEVWFYTGGPHGGWGTGSAWAAIDFAPPDDLTDVETACYVSSLWATAVAGGVVARTDEGVVVLDLDGDGNEATGWSILYLHLAADGKIAEGTGVNAGDRLGRPSCEGGFSNGTHMHIARRYNGEWIPADCSTCSAEHTKPTFVLGNWTVIGLPGQEYQGFLRNGTEQAVAEQGRLTPVNLVSW